MSEYTEQAEAFLKRHGLKFKAVKVGYGPYFPDDKESRDIYRLELRRTKEVFGIMGVVSGVRVSFRFGASLNDTASGEAPTAYDLLAGLTKYDPGTLDEFCREYGYDTDSRRAEKTYKGVKLEWAKVSRFFTAGELDELREIN